jgi:NAD(P)-dependent dehydrogenase (short-subunit alcohol dehydrogenase family)
VSARTVVLTGAAGTLGASLARRFAAEHDTNLMVSDIDSDRLQETVESLAGLPAHVAARAADVADADAVNGLVSEAVERFGDLDVMLNNAGALNPNARMHNLTAADWDRTIRVNLMGVVHGINAAVAVMRRRGGGGAIVNTASIAGMTAWPYAAPYCAAKAAIIQVTRVAAIEYAADRIRVNCVCPGAFRSGIHDGLPDSSIEAMGDRHPLGLARPEDVVGAFAYLASDEARWTTGSAVVVDGGYTAV